MNARFLISHEELFSNTLEMDAKITLQLIQTFTARCISYSQEQKLFRCHTHFRANLSTADLQCGIEWEFDKSNGRNR